MLRWLNLIIVLFCGINTIVIASNSNDSIDVKLGNLTGDDKLREMHSMAMDIVSVQPDRADSLANQILNSCSKEQGLFKGLAYYVKAESHFYKEEFDDAIKFYLRAEPFFNEERDSARLSGVYSNLALVHSYKANYKTSMLYYEQSLKIDTDRKNRLGMAKTLQNMGLIFGNWKKYELQKSYYSRALNIYKELEDKRSIADMSLNIGATLVMQKKYEEGYPYYIEALQSYKELKDSVRIASVKTNIGCYYNRLERYDDAYNYIIEAIELFENVGEKRKLISAYSALGDLYLGKGEKSKAIEIYQKCEEITSSLGIMEQKADNLHCLYKTYKEISDFENALRVHEQYIVIRDSIYAEEKLDKILELENKYLLQKSQNKVTELTAKNRLYTIIFLGIAFALISGGVFLIFYTRDRGMKEKQRLLSLEQKVLRTQMNPHFIFNSLSAIQCYILENKIMDAVDFLADFASLMRMVLHYSREEYITLEQEREVLDFYIDLQNKRFGDMVKYRIEIDEGLENSSIMIPPMLAQPFIENSFEHGELYKRNDGEILVKFKKKGKSLSYLIEDNGIGISAKIKESNSPTTKKHKSMALKITKERLKLINKSHVGHKINLTVEDRSKYGKSGTRVEFTIPLEEMN